MASAPIRTCIGCRRSVSQADLLRFVAVRGQVLPDSRTRQAGRGAYLHPSRDCFDLAVRRKAVNRALHASGDLDLTPLRQVIDTHQ